MADVTGALAEYQRFLAEVVELAGVGLAERVREAAPVGKENGGTLRDSFEPEQCLTFDSAGPYNPTVEIRTDVEYASYVDAGTNAHEIAAVNASALRFFWENGPEGPAFYYFKRVWHPGTLPGNFFEGPMLERWLESLVEAVELWA